MAEQLGWTPLENVGFKDFKIDEKEQVVTKCGA